MVKSTIEFLKIASTAISVMVLTVSAVPLPQPEFVDAGASTNVALSALSVSGELSFSLSFVPGAPPAWFYEPDWNIACVIVRGAGIGGELGGVKAVIDGTVLKLR